jgi:hypothetical protein
MTEITKLVVLYNTPVVNHWRLLLNSFVGDLLTSGLYYDSAEIIIIAHENAMISEIRNNLSSLQKIRILTYEPNVHLGTETLRVMCNHPLLGDPSCAFSFNSARSVSYSLESDPKRYLSVLAWAKLLNYFAITRYRDARSALRTHDTSGTNWVDENNRWGWPPHYQGGGWWARATYLAKLPKAPSDDELVMLLADNDTYRSKPGKSPGWTLWSEFWIGMGRPKAHESFSAYPKESPLNWHYVNILSENSYDASFQSGGVFKNRAK